ncbi:MAG TPA: 16S rRNA (cytosine(967)-C(5))-methyltransferase RsmB [Burkholderiales bacterium]|nr:16S rRNA (cytosine(967)-C(5))-methyltransferase RsmB [Burkholderiales bacterium]
MVEIQKLAAKTIRQVFSGVSLTPALALLRKAPLDENSRAAVHDISYGVARHYGLLSALLDHLLTTQVTDDRLHYLLLVGLYQLEFTRAKPYAVVDSLVEAGGPAGGLVNAVMRRFLRDRTRLLELARSTEAGRFSYPHWWIERVKRQYPVDFAQILEAGNRHPSLTLRVNARKISVAEYLRLLDAAGMRGKHLGESGLQLEKPVAISKIPGFAQGFVSVHDFGAQFAAPLLDVEDGMRVLDACAAPGGKTAHLLELARIRLVALDRDAERLAKVRENLDRLQLSAQLVCADAGAPADWWDQLSFDRILVDAPCTASGVVRRHPDIKWLRRESDVAQAAAEQQRLLCALWQILAGGGKLLYATCSIFAEENVELIEAFLRTHDDAELLPVARLESRKGQLLPNDRHDGFYFALLQKKS